MSQLTVQLLLGSALIVAGTAIQALGIGLAMTARPHLGHRFRRFGKPILIAMMAAGALWMLAWQAVGIWLWAFTLVWVGAFEAMEASLYFALAAYTTLGFGDVLPPQDWRILGALAGAHGMLGFGLATAALIEFVRRTGDEISRR